MQSRWTAFAHGLAPDVDGAPAWDRYEAGRTDAPRQTLVIDRQDAVVSDLDAPLRAAWGDEVLTFR